MEGWADHMLPPDAMHFITAVTPDGNGMTYNAHINVALAVAMPDGGLITPVLKVRSRACF